MSIELRARVVKSLAAAMFALVCDWCHRWLLKIRNFGNHYGVDAAASELAGLLEMKFCLLVTSLNKSHNRYIFPQVLKTVDRASFRSAPMVAVSSTPMILIPSSSPLSNRSFRSSDNHLGSSQVWSQSIWQKIGTLACQDNCRDPYPLRSFMDSKHRKKLSILASETK